MGKKIPFDMAINMGLKKKNDSIYAPPNKYGYKISINHPKIRPLYEAYKRRIGEQILSDAQRFHFEMLILEMIRRNNHVQQSNPDGQTDG